MQNGCGSLLKVLFGVVNLLVLGVGTVLIGISVYSLVGDPTNINHILSTNIYSGMAYVLIVIGSGVAFLGFIGCCGAFMESGCMLCTYGLLLTLLSLLSLAATIYIFTADQEKLKKSIQDKMKKDLQSYNSNAAIKHFWDTIQTQGQCCGVDGSDDWKTTNNTHNIPESCCLEPTNCTSTTKPELIHSSGCYTRMRDFFQENEQLFQYSCLGLGLFLSVVITISCCLRSKIGDARPDYSYSHHHLM